MSRLAVPHSESASQKEPAGVMAQLGVVELMAGVMSSHSDDSTGRRQLPMHGMVLGGQ